MPGSPNTSFIPKHTSNKAERKNTPRRIFIGTIIVRVLFFVVLIIAVGTYAYERRLSSDLVAAEKKPEDDTKLFNVEEMIKVIDFDQRLQQASTLWKSSASIASLLEVIESSTISSVQIESFDLERVDRASYNLNLSLETDNYDSVITQRKAYQANGRLGFVEFENVAFTNQKADRSVASIPGDTNTIVSLGAVLNVKVDDISYIPRTISKATEPLTPSQSSIDEGNLTFVSEAVSEDNNEIES